MCLLDKSNALSQLRQTLMVGQCKTCAIILSGLAASLSPAFCFLLFAFWLFLFCVLFFAHESRLFFCWWVATPARLSCTSRSFFIGDGGAEIATVLGAAIAIGAMTWYTLLNLWEQQVASATDKELSSIAGSPHELQDGHKDVSPRSRIV